MTTIVVICSVLFAIGVFDMFDGEMAKHMNGVFERHNMSMARRRTLVLILLTICSPFLIMNGALVVVHIIIFLLNKILGFR